jgi:hypothetical protein
MRDQLHRINKIRARFRATVAGFDQRTSYGHPKPMVLLTNVRDAQHGHVLTDHVHFDRRKWVDALELQPGDEIEFDARVNSYVKGYAGERSIDYKLNHPTRIIKRSAEPAELPLFSVLHL